MLPREAEAVATRDRSKPVNVAVLSPASVNSGRKMRAGPRTPIAPPTATRGRIGWRKKIAAKTMFITWIRENTTAVRPLVMKPMAK